MDQSANKAEKNYNLWKEESKQQEAKLQELKEDLAAAIGRLSVLREQITLLDQKEAGSNTIDSDLPETPKVTD